MTKDEVINKLGLIPLLPEGGYVKELYKGEKINGRPIYSSIYYLLTPDTISRMHKLQDDELWFYHDGSAVELYLIYDDHDEIRYLGKDLENSEEPQIRVPSGVYMGARMKDDGEYSLLSTSMAPGYCDEGFALGTYEELKDLSDHKELLKVLTQKNSFVN